MSACATFLANAAERAPRWSLTGDARARPDRCPASLPARLSSQRDLVTGAPARPIGPTSGHNHPTAALPLLATNPFAAVKPP
jgi:hypothetical protein